MSIQTAAELVGEEPPYSLLASPAAAQFVALNARKLDDALGPAWNRRFEYFGLRTVYDRYLLRHPSGRLVVVHAC